MRVNYAIVFVSDMDRSVKFYRDVVGMTLRFQSSHWTEFATDGATLRRIAVIMVSGPLPTCRSPRRTCGRACLL